MNDKFKTIFDNSNMTMYELAAKTGIPYTTVNKLVHDKLDINRISAEALLRLSVVLDTGMPDLLNHVEIMDNATGHCGKIKYRWVCKKDENAFISFEYKGTNVFIDMEEPFNTVRERKYYDYFAQMAIERYVKRARFEESLTDTIKERQDASILP